MKLLIKAAVLIHFLLLNNIIIYSQSIFNPNPIKNLLFEKNSLRNSKLINPSISNFKIIYNQFYYLNTNLPNLENLNGLYLNKGFGSFSGLLFIFENDNFLITAEPRINIFKDYPNELPIKKQSFSVLNDVPLSENDRNNENLFKNIGIKLKYNRFNLGYGNWSQWWGPGIHNSLIMSNNSNGFYHLNAEISNSNLQKSNFNYRFRYILSNPFINDANSKYYLSGWFLNISYNKIEAGASRNILSGGYQDLNWDYFDAMLIPFTNKNLKYWDEINDFFIKYTSKKNKFVIFIEYGVPNRFFDGKDPAIYNKHSVGSNIGFRKYDAFDKMGLLLGAEYTRLVQGQFFDRIPTPNWYDNVKYNYSSYNGRRWGAHSGSDSDDLLLYFGHLDSKKSIIFGFNYERHGVTYIFPPEVKFEYRLSASYKIFNTFITINYENEYFEHYSFVDNSANVWNDDFEIGSVQRSRTLLLSLEKEIR